MKVAVVTVGMLEVNAYLVWNQGNESCLIIDPGDDSELLLQRLQELGVSPVGILLTHGHVDHIRGVGDLAAAHNVPVFVHSEDQGLYASPDNALMPWLPAAAHLPAIGVVPNDLPGLEFRVIHTPGHTRGGCCYYFPNAEILFSGDTLFRRGIGRTDLPGGDSDTLLRAIREKLLVLPENTMVYPGHGPATTIGREAATNPFLVD